MEDRILQKDHGKIVEMAEMLQKRKQKRKRLIPMLAGGIVVYR